jgi:hypothetical protein
MLSGMVLGGVGPEIIELKLNKVWWERLQKLRRQLDPFRVSEKTHPRLAGIALLVQRCDGCLGEKNWPGPAAPQ